MEVSHERKEQKTERGRLIGGVADYLPHFFCCHSKGLVDVADVAVLFLLYIIS